jgi:regulator of sigma E protease
MVQNDRVRGIDGQQIDDWQALVEKIASHAGQSLRFQIERDGALLDFTIIPDSVENEGQTVGRIGVFAPEPPALDPYLVDTRYGLVQGLLKGAETTWIMSAVTVKLFAQMLSGRSSTEHLSGPITIARFAGQSASLGLSQFLAFLAVLSVSLGLINLLPIPVLDGGHLVYFLIEGITRRPIPERVMMWGQQLGISIIVVLMGLAFYNDLSGLFV